MSGTTSAEHQDLDDGRFGRSVALGIGIGLPVSLVLVTLAVWLVLDVSIGRAFAIAAWPAVLTGVFGGGFVGVVRGSA